MLPDATTSAARPIELPTVPLGAGLACHVPGLGLTLALAMCALTLGHWSLLQDRGIGALTVSILIGIVLGNSAYARIAGPSGAGVAFARQTLLRAGIILYGLRLTFQDIGHVGLAGVLIDAIMLSSTFTLSVWIGTRMFGLDRRTAMLIGAGSSICGAAAVLAAEPVIRGRSEQVTVAVSTVVVFGTLAIFLYPALYHAMLDSRILPMKPQAYGVFVGSTVHEVAQVVAAGRAVSQEAANTAVITKMVRVMMLAPFLMALSAWLSRRQHATGDVQADLGEDDAACPRRITVPWFALGFVLVCGFNSLALLPRAWVAVLTDLDTLLLAMSMAALGLTTQASALRAAGTKPLLLAAILFGWLLGGGLGVNALVSALLS